MLSHLLRRILGATIALALLVLALGAFGAWRWHRLSHPRPADLRAWDVAPAATVYLYYIPSVPRFYSRFFKYHQSSLASPTLVAADRRGQSNPILHAQPAQTIRQTEDELMETSGGVILSDYFAAMLAPAEGTHDFSVLLGGKCLNASFSSWMFRRAFSKAGFSWSELIAAGITFQVGSRKGEQVFVAHAGDWLFLSHQLSAVEKAVRAAGKEEANNLGASAAFRESRDATLRDSLIWIYTDIPNCVATAGATGVPEVAQVIVSQMPGLRAVAYSFRTEGPHGIAIDLMSYTLDPATAAAAVAALPPIDSRFFNSATTEALSVMTGSVDLERLAGLPLLNAGQIARIAEAAPGAPSSRQFYRLVARDRPGSRATTWDIVDRTSLAKTNAPEWVAAAGRLPGAASPFLEIRFNYRGIIASLLEEMQADWSPWQSAGERLGLPMPGSPPRFNAADYFNSTRVTAGFEGNTLSIYHSLQLGKAGNTDFTALDELSAFFLERELKERCTALRRPFVLAGGAEAPAWANSLDVAYVSGLFTSPVLTNHNGGSVALSVLVLDTLAGVSQAPSD